MTSDPLNAKGETMHSFKATNGTVFIHNPDLSGLLEVVKPDGSRTLINGPDLAEFVADVCARWITKGKEESGAE